MKKTANKKHTIKMAKRKAARALKFKNKKKTAPSLRNHAMKSVLDNMVEVSMRYLENGVNYFYGNNGGVEQAREFVEKMGADTCFSVGVRGMLVKGNLQVSDPLTWVPRATLPLVKDYLTELWNPAAKGYTIQINAFSFFLVDDENSEDLEDLFDEQDEDDEVDVEGEKPVSDVSAPVEESQSEEAESEEAETEESETEEAPTSLEDMKATFDRLMRDSFGDNYQEKLDALQARQDPFLAACVIMAGESISKLNGYLVLRKAEYIEGKGISLEGENIYLSMEDVLDIHVPPMIMNDVLKVIKSEEAPVEKSEETSIEETPVDVSEAVEETQDHVKV